MRRIERAEKPRIPADSVGNKKFISIPFRSRLSGSVSGPRQRLQVDVGFWTTFFLLNSLLYLPVVLMDREDGSILPTFQFAGLSLDQVWRQIFVWRREPDLLRFNSEIVLFVALWTVWPWLRKSWTRFAFVLVYVLLFLYYLYEGVTFTFFSLEPVFYTQMRMATEGFSFFLENARVTTAFVAGTVLLIIGGAALVAPAGAVSHCLTTAPVRSRAQWLVCWRPSSSSSPSLFQTEYSDRRWFSAVWPPNWPATYPNPSACMRA